MDLTHASFRQCNQCQPGFWSFPDCRVCQCNDHASICDQKTGACIECRDLTDGYYCDRCKVRSFILTSISNQSAITWIFLYVRVFPTVLKIEVSVERAEASSFLVVAFKLTFDRKFKMPILVLVLLTYIYRSQFLSARCAYLAHIVGWDNQFSYNPEVTWPGSAHVVTTMWSSPQFEIPWSSPKKF